MAVDVPRYHLAKRSNPATVPEENAHELYSQNRSDCQAECIFLYSTVVCVKVIKPQLSFTWVSYWLLIYEQI